MGPASGCDLLASGSVVPSPGSRSGYGSRKTAEEKQSLTRTCPASGESDSTPLTAPACGRFLGGALIRNVLCFAVLVAAATLSAQNPSPSSPTPSQPKASAQPDWVSISNNYARMLIEITFKYRPEFGSQQGLAQYDTKVSQPTLANEDKERADTEAVLAKLKAASQEKQLPQVDEDLQIMMRKVDLEFRRQDFQRAHEVPFLNASQIVFMGLRILLDDQTPAERWPSAVTRMRAYAGLEPGYTAITEILKERVQQQMAKPGVFYPSRTQIETEMARNSNYIDGIAALMQKHNLTGWQ